MLSRNRGCFDLHEFRGTPEEMGREHGIQLRESISYNLNKLIRHGDIKEILAGSDRYARWVGIQEELIGKEFPWLIDELKSIALSAGVDYCDLLNLTHRGWWYAAKISGRSMNITFCSSIAITLEDGTVACGGTLDDPADIWPFPARYVPEKGYRFITIPFPGTVWGGRGMNSEGLCISTSSQGLQPVSIDGFFLDDVLICGIPLRVILQTCSKVEEVRDICRKYKFQVDLVCVDAKGDIFCAHQTPTGMYEIPSIGYAALANTISDDRLIYKAGTEGWTPYPENLTSRFRRGNLLDFISRRNGKCSLDEVAGFIGSRDDKNPGTIHNSGTAYITLANPEVCKNSIWIRQVKKGTDNKDFIEFTI